MSDTSKRSVSFECRSIEEADLIRNAVSRYQRVLKDLGIDPRNYAPANDEGAGFGWDAVQRAASDMGHETMTHMSRRMAEAIRAALWVMAERTPAADVRIRALSVTGRLSTLIGSN